MKRLLAFLGLVAVVCWWRGHVPKRQFIGGLRCSECGCPFGDLGRMRPDWRPKDAA
jgi:hypothetical protein